MGGACFVCGVSSEPKDYPLDMKSEESGLASS